MGDPVVTVQFPEIQPTDCRFAEPEWPTSMVRSQSGVRSVRLWGDKPSDARLLLEFANITHANYQLIRAAYQAAKSDVDDVSLPAIVFKNVNDAELLSFLESGGDGARWYFVKGSPPDGRRIPGGSRWTVSVELRAELRL